MSDLKLYGTGRRKRSIARVFLKSGSGKIIINGKNYKDYLCRDSLATIVTQPLALLEIEDSYDIEINVNGGGLTGQAGAIRLGISRALNTVNEDYRKIIEGNETELEWEKLSKAQKNLPIAHLYNKKNIAHKRYNPFSRELSIKDISMFGITPSIFAKISF